jgi:hypothetical protein
MLAAAVVGVMAVALEVRADRVVVVLVVLVQQLRNQLTAQMVQETLAVVEEVQVITLQILQATAATVAPAL